MMAKIENFFFEFTINFMNSVDDGGWRKRRKIKMKFYYIKRLFTLIECGASGNRQSALHFTITND